MIICAMTCGLPTGIKISSLLIVILVFTFTFLLIVKAFRKRLAWRYIFTTTFLVPISIFIIGLAYNLIHEFVTTPMKVKKSDIAGDYVINTNLFKGKNADWQYEHYWIRIKKDTLYLNVMNGGELVKTFKRKIYYTYIKKHRFFRFYNEWNFDYDRIMYIRDTNISIETHNYPHLRDTMWIHSKVTDSIFNARLLNANLEEHHMLRLNPILHVDPFIFNVVLRSTKYGNMFFRNGKWKKDE